MIEYFLTTRFTTLLAKGFKKNPGLSVMVYNYSKTQQISANNNNSNNSNNSSNSNSKINHNFGLDNSDDEAMKVENASSAKPLKKGELKRERSDDDMASNRQQLLGQGDSDDELQAPPAKTKKAKQLESDIFEGID